MREKILFLGAADGQVPMIKLLKEKGYHITVVSPLKDSSGEVYPGIPIADDVLNENVLNKEKIAKWAKDKNFKAVMSFETDLTVPSVAYIAEKLGLPTYGFDNAINYTDKGRMHDIFNDLRIPVIDGVTVSKFEEALTFANKIKYPIIVKPSDSSGSKGISRVNCEEELKDKFEDALSNSKNSRVVVEKYIEGTQHISLGYVDEYNLTMFACLDRYYMKLKDIFIPSSTIAPSIAPEQVKGQVNDYMERIVKYTKPRFGNVWAEWIFDKITQKPYIIEISIREAGACITSHIFPYSYGVNTMEYMIKSSMGEGDGSFKNNKFSNQNVGIFYFTLPEGIIEEIHGVNEVKKIPNILFFKLKNISVGDKISKPKDKTNRIGFVVIKGDNRNEIFKILNMLKQVLKITVISKNNKKGIIWD